LYILLKINTLEVLKQNLNKNKWILAQGKFSRKSKLLRFLVGEQWITNNNKITYL